MKRNLSFLCLFLVFHVLFYSCATTKFYGELTTPEESGLNMTRITDENSSVYGPRIDYGITTIERRWVGGLILGSYQNVAVTTERDRVNCVTVKCLALSPDGKELAYLSDISDKVTLCVRSTGGGTQVTQRSQKSANSVFWGTDEKLYFGCYIDNTYVAICGVNSHSGSAMKQYTSNNHDCNPALSSDGKRLLFERVQDGESSIWCYDIATSTLTLCCQGECPTPVNESGTQILCSRKNNGREAIWLIDYEKGEETLILAADDKDYSCPVLSPDKQWILCQGSSYSSYIEKNQIDIFCVKMDGTQLTHLTTHPCHDVNPVWSSDGKYIYFLSQRGSKEHKYAIWRMNFNL